MRDNRRKAGRARSLRDRFFHAGQQTDRFFDFGFGNEQNAGQSIAYDRERQFADRFHRDPFRDRRAARKRRHRRGFIGRCQCARERRIQFAFNGVNLRGRREPRDGGRDAGD